MSPICLARDQVRTLHEILNEYGAKSLIIRNLIQNDFPFGKFEVWVDVWPNFSAVLIKWDWTETPVSRIKYYYYEFSLSDASFRRLLENTNLFPLNQSEFVVITDERRATLEAFLEDNGYDVFCNNKYYDIFSIEQSNIINVSAPTDLTVGSLTTECAELVARNWEYTEMDKIDSYKEFIKLLIATYPSTCLFTSSNEPVAYAIGQEYGGIGMLYVHPKYRGRGYAKAVMSILTRKFFSKGLTPYIVVDIKNLQSVSLNKKLGYESTESKINWYTPFPKTSKR